MLALEPFLCHPGFSFPFVTNSKIQVLNEFIISTLLNCHSISVSQNRLSTKEEIFHRDFDIANLFLGLEAAPLLALELK